MDALEQMIALNIYYFFILMKNMRFIITMKLFSKNVLKYVKCYAMIELKFLNVLMLIRQVHLKSVLVTIGIFR